MLTSAALLHNGRDPNHSRCRSRVQRRSTESGVYRAKLAEIKEVISGLLIDMQAYSDLKHKRKMFLISACSILQSTSGRLCSDVCGNTRSLDVGCLAGLLHVLDRVLGLEVDLVDTVLVDKDTVEVEFDGETCRESVS